MAFFSLEGTFKQLIVLYAEMFSKYALIFHLDSNVSDSGTISNGGLKPLFWEFTFTKCSLLVLKFEK